MKTFNIDLSEITGNLGTEAELNTALIKDVRAKMGLDLLSGLQLATPVDTGEARNGWQMEATEDQTVVENRVPHIGALNNGHSKQAPAGFVENCIDAVTKR